MIATRPVVRDILVLIVIVGLSAASSATGLGFYEDDWDFLSDLALGAEGSLLNEVGFLMSDDVNVALRPTQAVLLATRFRLFGTEPLGHHLLVTGLVAALAVAIYLLGRELGARRDIAVAVALLFVLLPSHASARFWLAAADFHLLSMLAATVSLHADLRAVRGEHDFWLWKTLALVLLVIAGLGFEAVLPFLVLAPPVIWWIERKRAGPLTERLGRLRTAVLLAGSPLALIGIVAYKLTHAVGAGLTDQPWVYLGRLLVGPILVHGGTYGVGLPHTVLWAANRAGPATMAAAVMAAALVFVGLRHGQNRPVGNDAPTTRWGRLGLIGTTLFALGYGIFLTTSRIIHTSTGASNRANLAAGVGFAVILVTGAGAIASWKGWRPNLFAGIVAALTAGFVLVLGAIGDAWEASWEQQQEVLAQVAEDVPHLPQGGTMLLSGVCAYDGPAMVFESRRGLTGALELVHDDRSVDGDVTSRGVSVNPEGVTTKVYNFEFTYPYGPNLFHYDLDTGAVSTVTDPRTARRLLPDDVPCPGEPGIGALHLPFDRLYLNLTRDDGPLRWR